LTGDQAFWTQTERRAAEEEIINNKEKQVINIFSAQFKQFLMIWLIIPFRAIYAVKA